MAVFSLADRASYEKLQQWLSDARTQASRDITILIVGNKSDLADRQVSVIEASKMAQSEGCAYVETSARTGENVEASFFKLARSVLTRMHDGRLAPDAASAARGGSVLKKGEGASTATGYCC